MAGAQGLHTGRSAERRAPAAFRESRVYLRESSIMTRPTSRALILSIGLLSSTVGILGGQSPAPVPPLPPPQSPEASRFRVGVDAVRIDAVVTDSEGRTVPNLTAADFEVRQDGKVQPVTFFEYMPVQSGPPPASPRPAAAPVARANTQPVPSEEHKV